MKSSTKQDIKSEIDLDKNILNATKDILEKNLKIIEKPFFKQKKILIFDKNSELTEKIWKAYLKKFLEIENKNNNLLEKFLEKIWIKKSNFEYFIFDKNNENNQSFKNKIKNKLLNLEENSTVVMVQSTNFRFDNFRIRLNLHNRWIWCLEHNHLWYIKKDQYQTYADCIKYRTPYYNALSNWLKEKADKATEVKFECHNWSILIWKSDDWNLCFEDMKQNTLNFDWKRRWWSLPWWENFNEIKNFDNLNWELSIYTFPWEDFQIITTKPFRIRIEKSRVYKIKWENYPEEFLKILDKIEKWENWEVFLRELWFWLNPWISRENQLSDVNAHERIEWFHVSLWKKHNIYRKKFHKNISQRYHIDIFPDTKAIYFKIWDKLEKIFESDKKNWIYKEKFLFQDREKFWE